MACGMLLVRETEKKLSVRHAFFLCAAYLFNPAVFLNSSVWGQVDSLTALAAVIMCISLMRGKMYPAYTAFGIGFLIKPQILLLGPVLRDSMRLLFCPNSCTACSNASPWPRASLSSASLSGSPM